MMMRGLPAMMTAVLFGLGTVAPAAARDITVKMKNIGAGGVMVFEPSYVAAAVGDRVHFVSTDPGHNAEPIGGMVPDGVSLPAGAIGKDYVLTVAKPGVYGIKCKPHYPMGMVALVKAGPGAPVNLAAATAVKLPPLAAKRMTPMLEQAR